MLQLESQLEYDDENRTPRVQVGPLPNNVPKDKIELLARLSSERSCISSRAAIFFPSDRDEQRLHIGVDLLNITV